MCEPLRLKTCLLFFHKSYIIKYKNYLGTNNFIMTINKKELKNILSDQEKKYEKFAEKQTKEYKELLKEQEKKYQNYIGALKEDFDAKVEAIGEQYADIKKKLDSHTKKLDSHTKKLDSHTKKLDSHTKKLDSHAEMIASMQEDITIMKSDIGFVKKSLKRKVDVDEFENLEKRVTKLETKIKTT